MYANFKDTIEIDHIIIAGNVGHLSTWICDVVFKFVD